MPRTGPPRSSSDPHADRWRAPTPEQAPQAPKFKPRSGKWLPVTVASFKVYMASDAAKLLRAEDEDDVLRLFDYRDKRTRLWDSVEEFDAIEAAKALTAIRTLEGMINGLQKHLGIGPAPRASFGVVTNRQPGSSLKEFLGSGGAAAGS